MLNTSWFKNTSKKKVKLQGHRTKMWIQCLLENCVLKSNIADRPRVEINMCDLALCLVYAAIKIPHNRSRLTHWQLWRQFATAIMLITVATVTLTYSKQGLPEVIRLNCCHIELTFHNMNTSWELWWCVGPTSVIKFSRCNNSHKCNKISFKCNSSHRRNKISHKCDKNFPQI